MKTDYYNQKGEKSGTFDLPENIFGVSWNQNAIWQTLISFAANQRRHYSHAKGRGEVRGGGKKPWQQKGLGKARHGSIRSPIWTGGGVSHGPNKEENFSRKINKKAKKKALFALLSQKLRENEILFLDKIETEKGKTKEARNILNNLKKIGGFEKLGSRGGKTMLATREKDKITKKAFANLPYLKTEDIRNLNIIDLANFKYLIVPKEEIGAIKSKTKN
ncbi:MAG: 50S ribosomal protein L4 [Candidatus Niyogibacteria bacterium RIFCSPLOWO2_12_FULL_41_13]|uniref:Large ribosomal subunit protein uL4 n=1 Tax=Candidatus Niyogibacteria bacterium RIFCSPLOWO2_12_FULL_41_13 TaxID=1801726 RepID=A0A1G2F2K7_9BACT|nr:MAG: 50S ribosomal protein L4 [Candidatus Niyogibacteria bacterium RIFCSPLOWO2_12_FULL_41_13]